MGVHNLQAVLREKFPASFSDRTTVQADVDVLIVDCMVSMHNMPPEDITGDLAFLAILGDLMQWLRIPPREPTRTRRLVLVFDKPALVTRRKAREQARRKKQRDRDIARETEEGKYTVFGPNMEFNEHGYWFINEHRQEVTGACSKLSIMTQSHARRALIQFLVRKVIESEIPLHAEVIIDHEERDPIIVSGRTQVCGDNPTCDPMVLGHLGCRCTQSDVLGARLPRSGYFTDPTGEGELDATQFAMAHLKANVDPWVCVQSKDGDAFAALAYASWDVITEARLPASQPLSQADAPVGEEKHELDEAAEDAPRSGSPGDGKRRKRDVTDQDGDSPPSPVRAASHGGRQRVHKKPRQWRRKEELQFAFSGRLTWQAKRDLAFDMVSCVRKLVADGVHPMGLLAACTIKGTDYFTRKPMFFSVRDDVLFDTALRFKCERPTSYDDYKLQHGFMPLALAVYARMTVVKAMRLSTNAPRFERGKKSVELVQASAAMHRMIAPDDDSHDENYDDLGLRYVCAEEADRRMTKQNASAVLDRAGNVVGQRGVGLDAHIDALSGFYRCFRQKAVIVPLKWQDWYAAMRDFSFQVCYYATAATFGTRPKDVPDGESPPASVQPAAEEASDVLE